MKILGSTSWHTESLMTNEEITKAAIARLGGWIPHKGGDCPLPGRKIVEIKLRNGQIIGPITSAGFFWPWVLDWSEDLNVMAYRIIK